MKSSQVVKSSIQHDLEGLWQRALHPHVLRLALWCVEKLEGGGAEYILIDLNSSVCVLTNRIWGWRKVAMEIGRDRSHGRPS